MTPFDLMPLGARHVRQGASGNVVFLLRGPANAAVTKTQLSGPATSTATWVASTKTLTQSGAFSLYAWKSGDVYHLTSGTGATVGDYAIVSATANTLVLATAIAVGNLATADIVGTIYNSWGVKVYDESSQSPETYLYALTGQSLDALNADGSRIIAASAVQTDALAPTPAGYTVNWLVNPTALWSASGGKTYRAEFTFTLGNAGGTIVSDVPIVIDSEYQ